MNRRREEGGSRWHLLNFFKLPGISGNVYRSTTWETHCGRGFNHQHRTSIKIEINIKLPPGRYIVVVDLTPLQVGIETAKQTGE